MTASPPPLLPEPTPSPDVALRSSAALPLTPAQTADLMAALPRLGRLTDLLSRLLTALESPSGEVSQSLAAMMEELSGVAAALQASAAALTAMAGETGLLAAMAAGQERIEAEMAALREEMRADARARRSRAAREDALVQRLDQAIAWLGGPMAESGLAGAERTS